MKAAPIAASVMIACAGTALAEPVMNHQLDDRIVVGFGSQETVAGTFDFDSLQDMPANAFEDWSGNAGAGVDAGGGFAQLTSTITSTSINAMGSANASATFDSSEHNYVSALGSSSHTIGFSIDETITFSLIANLQAQGAANAWIRIRDGFFPGSNLLHDFTVMDDTLNISQNITLGPGEYSVQFFANSNIILVDPGSIAGNSSFDAAWTVVPAPATPILAIAAIPTLARRRRSAPPA
jgi:hypothetical protein